MFEVFGQVSACVATMAALAAAVIQGFDYQNNKLQKEWEQQREEDSHKPRFQMARVGEIPLDSFCYEQYVLCNEGGIVNSGRMSLEAKFVITYDGRVVKNIAVDRCFYEDMPDYQEDSGDISICLWMPGRLEYAQQTIQKSVEEMLEEPDRIQKLEVELNILACFNYVDWENEKQEEIFLLRPGEHPACERYGGEARLSHDRYHITRENILGLESEEEYQEIMEEVSKRLARLERE